jgi:hypothetical protein
MPRLPPHLAKIHGEVTKDMKPLVTQSVKMFDNESKRYAHYPDFLKDDKPTIELNVKKVEVPELPGGVGKLSQEQYKTELDAQRKRAEVRAGSRRRRALTATARVHGALVVV